MTPRRPIALAAGGTGGHLYPAVALSDELVRRGYPVIFLTDERGAAYGGLASKVDRVILTAGRLDRGWLQRIAGIANLVRGTVQAHGIYRKTQPLLVVGFGGYPSLAPILAARICGIRCIVHEQNALLGRANRLAARFATAIALSYESTARIPAAATTHYVGNPVRQGVADAATVTYRPPAKDGPVNILVLGGSQGASIFSQVLPAAVENLADRGRLRINHQCRPGDIDQTRDTYARMGIAATVAPFFEDVASLLRDAHLVISRSGASTMAELGVVGRPAILVPYPYAADDHQLANALAMEAAGGAWVFSQADFTADKLSLRLDSLIQQPASLMAAAAAACNFGHRDAAGRLADLIATVASTPRAVQPNRAENAEQEIDRTEGQLRRGLA